MISRRLYKKEKLCSAVAISSLFCRDASVFSALAFPLRAVWRPNPDRRSNASVQFLISIPKKRLRHAVDRVTMRRRVREAYRLHRHEYPLAEGARIDLAFIYVDSSLQPYAKVEKAVCRILDHVSRQLVSAHTPSGTDNQQPEPTV